MVCSHSEVAAVNVILKIFDTPDPGEEFEFVNAIFGFGGIKETGGEGDRYPSAVLALFEDRAQPVLASVTRETCVFVGIEKFVLNDVENGLF